MAKFEYRVLAGISYPPNRRAEVGDIVSDLPKDSITWLVESGVVEAVEAKKPQAKFEPKVAVEEIEVADEL
jgi:hypothetical protein